MATLLEANADLSSLNNRGETPLHVAAITDDAEILAMLLEAGADIDAGEGTIGTPLLHALQSRRGSRTEHVGEVAVNALLEAGADFDAADSASNVPLLASLDPGHPKGFLGELPLRLLALGANPTWRDGQGRTPLHAASAAGRADVIHALIEAGADPLALTDDGATTLHAAAESGGPEAISLLSGLGVDADSRNDDGLAPLHLAVWPTAANMFVFGAAAEETPVPWLSRARALIEAGADPNARTPEGDTPLHLSMWHYDSTAVSLFHEAGADLNARNDQGETPLHIARARDNRLAVRTLMKLGADPGPVCHWAPGPVDVEAWDFLAEAPAESVRGCLESGIPPDERDDQGATYLARMITTSACCADFENVLAAFLEAGADVNARDDSEQTLLHRAVGMSGRRDADLLVDVTSALLTAGADPNARDLQGSTPLHLAAAAMGEPAGLARLLANAGADVNARDDASETPLHIALRGHLLGVDAALVRTLVQLGADTAARDSAGVAADPTACERWGESSFFALASVDIVADCISRGADARVGAGPRRPLALLPLNAAAAHTRDRGVVPLLLDAGADVHARASFPDFTALHSAAESGTAGTVRALLEAGADPNAWATGFSTDWGWGWTPLQLAARSNPDPEVARALLEAGADLAARSNESYRVGDSPLHYAGENANPEVAALLLDAGADVNALSRAQRTPLHAAAAEASSPRVIELLVAAGADVNARDRSGYAPLHSAASYNHRPAIAAALIAAGADVNAQDDPEGHVPSGRRANYRTPLFMAVHRGGAFISGQPMPTKRSAHVVEVLVRAGAEQYRVDGNGRNPLHAAAQSNPAVYPLLLRLDAYTGQRDADGRTPRDYAMENRSLEGLPEVRRQRGTPMCEDWSWGGFFGTASAELVQECLRAGANPDEVVFRAAEGAIDPGVIGVLVDFGANVNNTLRLSSGRPSRTPLHAAAAVHPDPAMVETLVAAGEDVDVRNLTGETPLHHAWTNTNPAVFRTLLRLGADPLARDERGRIADPTNCANWNTEAFIRLASLTEIEACVLLGEDVNARDSTGYAPLHWAAATDDPTLLTTLLEAGADVNAQNDIGATPLHVAAITESWNALTLLLDAGADRNVRDADGRTPADYARVIESRVLPNGAELVRLLQAMRVLRFRRDPGS